MNNHSSIKRQVLITCLFFLAACQTPVQYQTVKATEMEIMFPLSSNLETGDHFILNGKYMKHDAFCYFKPINTDTVFLPASIMSKSINDQGSTTIKSEPVSNFLYNQRLMIAIMQDTALGIQIVNSAHVDITGRLRIKSKTNDPIVLEIPRDHPMRVDIKGE